jgi:DNA-directed RNA polymerase subunit RPC12/RpoP
VSQILLKCPYCGSREIEEGYFADRSGWCGYRCKKCGRIFKDEEAEVR